MARAEPCRQGLGLQRRCDRLGPSSHQQATDTSLGMNSKSSPQPSSHRSALSNPAQKPDLSTYESTSRPSSHLFSTPRTLPQCRSESVTGFGVSYSRCDVVGRPPKVYPSRLPIEHVRCAGELMERAFHVRRSWCQSWCPVAKGLALSNNCRDTFRRHLGCQTPLRDGGFLASRDASADVGRRCWFPWHARGQGFKSPQLRLSNPRAPSGVSLFLTTPRSSLCLRCQLGPRRVSR
jgi:hypothetical protein